MLERVLTAILIPALLLLAVPPVDWNNLTEQQGNFVEGTVTELVEAVLLGTRSDENNFFVFTRNVPDEIQPSTSFTIIDSVQAKVDLTVLAIVPDLPAGFELISSEERSFELNISAGNSVDFIYEVRSPIEEGSYVLASTARGAASGQDSQAVSIDMNIVVSQGATDPPDPPVDPPVDPPTQNQPPVAFFSVSHDVALVGEIITFDGASSSDSDGSIADYIWNFGDGTTAQGQSVVAHEYPAPGTYQVSLTVVDNEGVASNPAFVTVSIESPPPPTIFGIPTQTALIIVGAIAAAAIIFFVARGFSGGGSGRPLSVSTDALDQTVREDVNHFLLTTGVPISGVSSIEVVEQVEDTSRARWVRMLTNDGLIVVYSPENDFQVIAFDRLSLNEASMIDANEIGAPTIQSFVNEHVEIGDTIIKLSWEALNGEAFESYAAVNSEGQIKYDTFMSLLPLAITAALQH